MNEPAPTNYATPPLVVSFISLGCPKNLIDSERMLASLALEGYVVTGDVEASDVVVINTCAFIDSARQESGQAISDALERKRRGQVQMVVVVGCYPQKSQDEILENWPDVDALIGISARDQIGKILRKLATSQSDLPLQVVVKKPRGVVDDRERLRLTPRHYAYLRITEGCDNRCSYCSIPNIRGPLRSKPWQSVVTEAEELLNDGVQEIIVIGQDTTAYGRDRRSAATDPDLAALLEKLDRLPGLSWLRLLYTHPASFTERLIRAYGELKNLLPYVDLPLQHINQSIMDSMGRRTARVQVEELIEALRRERPDLVLRTSFIIGYPGETDEQFQELLEFVRRVRFDRLGAFAFSREEGTRAANMSAQVPEEIKQARLKTLMALQRRISLQAQKKLIGGRAEVIIDRGTVDPQQPARGRFWGQAPDIDGITRVYASRRLEAGKLVQVKITAAGPYDLEGRAIRR